jgi:hypothetical protein
MKMPLGKGQQIDSSTREMTLKSHFLSFAKNQLQVQHVRKIINLRVRLAILFYFANTRK